MLENIKRELDAKQCNYEQVGSILRIRESVDGPFILITITDHIPCVSFINPPSLIFVYYPANKIGSKEWYYDCPEAAALAIVRHVERYYYARVGVPESRDVI